MSETVITINPKISVIVPVYNVEKYLCRCIDSILSQTFRDFELLLIDDGSTDGSGRICDAYAEKDHRVRSFHKKNGGVSSARNLGIENAKGEMLVFGDADDFFLPNALTNFANAMGDGVDMALLGVESKDGANLYDASKIKDGFFNYPVNHISWPGMQGYIYRKEIIEQNKLRVPEDVAYSEDKLFNVMYALCAKTIRHRAKFVYVYFKNEDSATASRDTMRIVSNQCKALAAAYRIMDAQSLHREERRGVLAACHYISSQIYMAIASKPFNLSLWNNCLTICNAELYEYKWGG